METIKTVDKELNVKQNLRLVLPLPLWIKLVCNDSL